MAFLHSCRISRGRSRDVEQVYDARCTTREPTRLRVKFTAIDISCRTLRRDLAKANCPTGCVSPIQRSFAVEATTCPHFGVPHFGVTTSCHNVFWRSLRLRFLPLFTSLPCTRSMPGSTSWRRPPRKSCLVTTRSRSLLMNRKRALFVD
jgi:hypothetical protein